MDELKQYIGENRSQFDNLEPSEGHFDRFQEMLQTLEVEPEKKIVSMNFSRLLKVASVCLLMVLSGLYVYDNWFARDSINAIQLEGEQYEAQQFYMYQVSQKVQTVEELSRILPEGDKSLLFDELNSMDEVIADLQEQLNAMPGDPRIIEALLKHYKTKLDILNAIIKDLNDVKQLKTKRYETVEL
jgi:hypothetical protein